MRGTRLQEWKGGKRKIKWGKMGEVICYIMIAFALLYGAYMYGLHEARQACRNDRAEIWQEFERDWLKSRMEHYGIDYHYFKYRGHYYFTVKPDDEYNRRKWIKVW